MPWKEVTTMSEKRRFVDLASQPGAKMSALCREFNITRRTGYFWRKRFKEYGYEGLENHSTRPHNSPNRTPDELEQQVLQVRGAHSRWGGVKIKEYLCTQGVEHVPSKTTIDNILKRHGRICPQESEKHKPFIRFEHENPNDLWQMDFKGHFATGDGVRCHPFTLLDDHSRFNLALRACTNERKDTVKSCLIDVFRTCGLPGRMTMDNGAPWGYSGEQLHTRLTAWLIRLGIRVYHSRPCHPQTQGKLERYHRTLKSELLSLFEFDDCAHAQVGFDDWRAMYNDERPHAAINLAVPSKRYSPSERVYPEDALPAIEYDPEMEVRKVQVDGLIYYAGKRYRVGQAFHGDPVGLKAAEEEDMIAVYYCRQKVLLLDLNHPVE